MHSHTGVIVECKDLPPYITIKYAKDTVCKIRRELHVARRPQVIHCCP